MMLRRPRATMVITSSDGTVQMMRKILKNIESLAAINIQANIIPNPKITVPYNQATALRVLRYSTEGGTACISVLRISSGPPILHPIPPSAIKSNTPRQR